MHYYCTYFDINFAARAFVLWESLQRHDHAPVLFALCLDERAYAAVQRLGDDHFIPIKLSDVEKSDARLPAAKLNRSLIEYYFTLSPFLPLYILKNNPHVDLLAYVDADCCFYADPQPVFDEMRNHSVAITEHHFAPMDAERLIYGRFNMGFQIYRNDRNAVSILENWARQCADWCYDRIEDGKYADQRYLDEWPGMGAYVHIVAHGGVNVGPWNHAVDRIRCRNHVIYVDKHPLILFHFHGLSFLYPNRFTLKLADSEQMVHAIRYLYLPYARSLCVHSRRLNVTNTLGVRRAISCDKPMLSIRLWPLPLYSVRWAWRSFLRKKGRKKCLDDMIMQYQKGDTAKCRKLLQQILTRFPSLLLNRHVINIASRVVFPGLRA